MTCTTEPTVLLVGLLGPGAGEDGVGSKLPVSKIVPVENAVSVTVVAPRSSPEASGSALLGLGVGVVTTADVKVIVRGTMGTEPNELLTGCGVKTVTTGVPDTNSGYSVTVVTSVLPDTNAV